MLLDFPPSVACKRVYELFLHTKVVFSFPRQYLSSLPWLRAYHGKARSSHRVHRQYWATIRGVRPGVFGKAELERQLSGIYKSSEIGTDGEELEHAFDCLNRLTVKISDVAIFKMCI